MNKRLLLLPYYNRSDKQWSLFVVANPGGIKVSDGGFERKYKTYLMHISSSRQKNTPEFKRMSSIICHWLNWVYYHEANDLYQTQTFNPRLFCDLDHLQYADDGFDSGAYMIQFIKTLMGVPSTEFSNHQDVYSNIKRYISSNDMVDMCYAIRIELFSLITKLRKIFLQKLQEPDEISYFLSENINNDHCGFNDEDDSETCSLNKNIYEDTTTSTPHESKNDSSYKTDSIMPPCNDECQEDFYYDDECSHISDSSEVSNIFVEDYDEDKDEREDEDFQMNDDMSCTNDSINMEHFNRNLNLNLTEASTVLMTGYQIQYKSIALSDKGFTRSATINNIIDMGEYIGCKLMLDNDDQLDINRHLIRITKFRVPSDGSFIHNTNQKWMHLNEFTIIPNVMENDNDSNYNQNGRRIRTFLGQTNDEIVNLNRGQSCGRKSSNNKLQPLTMTWDGIGASQRRTATKEINELYYQCINYGDAQTFYDSKIIKSGSIVQYRERKKKLKRKLKKFNDDGRLTLDIKSTVTYFRPNPESRLTNRDLLVKEKMFEFEFINKSLNIVTCPACLENIMVKIYSEKDRTKCEHQDWLCGKCTDSDYIKRDRLHYINTNRHPVWYERDTDGNILTDDNGNWIVRFDIPLVLSELTMAEKILIRRYQPYIPSHHIRNGMYGIRGHCVTFMQDISDVCNILPRQKESVVTFVRWLSNKKDARPFPKQMRVRKKQVLDALRWLKIHHSGYHDIIINESNLDWMGDNDCANIAEQSEHNIQVESKSNEQNEEEFVTIAHTVDDDDEEFLNSTMADNEKKSTLNDTNANIMNDLHLTKEQKGELGDCLEFPPVNVDDPIS